MVAQSFGTAANRLNVAANTRALTYLAIHISYDMVDYYYNCIYLLNHFLWLLLFHRNMASYHTYPTMENYVQHCIISAYYS